MAKANKKAETETTGTTLIPLQEVNAPMLFGGDGKDLDQLLTQIERNARSLVPDVTTEKGRKEIASVAYNIARSKTTLDDAGKEHASHLKAQVKAIDGLRKHARDKLDDLKTEIRAPLDEYERKEHERVEGHVNAITAMRSAGNYAIEAWQSLSVNELKYQREGVETIDPSTFEEFTENATETRLAALAKFETAISKREQYDREQAELEALRQEKAEREAREAAEAEERAQQEREQRIREEAAEKERKAAQERERKLREEKEAEERARKLAEQRAKEAEAEAAAKARREAEAEAAEKARRERNTRHKAKVHSEVVEALSASCKLSPEQARIVLDAIRGGKVPHVNVEY